MAHHPHLAAIIQLILHTLEGIGVRVGDGTVHPGQAVLGVLHPGAERILADQLGEGAGALVVEVLAHFREGLAQQEEGLVGLAVERVALGEGSQTGGGRAVAAFDGVETAHSIFALGDHFLDLAEHLLHLRHELAVGEPEQRIAALGLGLQCVDRIAVGFLHLLVVNLAYLLLGFHGLFHAREEGDEVLILGFGLGEGVGAALPVPTVGDGQLGFGDVLGVGIGVDEGLEGQPGDLEAAALDVADGPVEQDLVRLLGVSLDRVLVLLAAGATAGQGGDQDQSDQRETKT